MKFLLLIVIVIVTCLHTAHAQSNSWFKGTWYGEQTFPQSRIALKALLRMEVDGIKGNTFTGRLIYMYPSDTLARLIRRINGVLYGKYVIINKSEEIYRMDPRSRSFWSDCSHCPGTSSFYIINGNLVLQLTSSSCGDSCNGETTFRRKLQDYDTITQVVITKKFGANKPPATFANRAATAIRIPGSQVMDRGDSIKYFPTLLNDSMGIHFDPNKYVLPKTQSGDTASSKQQDALPKTIAKTTASPKQAKIKDSVIASKKNNAPAIIKTVVKDSLIQQNKAVQKDTTQLAAKPVNSKPSNAKNSKPAASKKDTVTVRSKPSTDTLAAAPAPVKDTIPAAITQRTTSLVNTYQVSSPHILVQLFDDGQIDGDAVSVYYNGKLIISNQTLTHKAITFTLEASAANRHHEFILISESEGFLPPNTALMRIKAGSQQFELNVSSGSNRNAKIAIDYTGE